MKVVIAGSRTVNHERLISDILDEIFISISGRDSMEEIKEVISCVISGGAKGVDSIGEKWAKRHGIPVDLFIPNWSLGKYAGIIRNRQMADHCDLLVAIWDGRSAGTVNMINNMKLRNKEYHVYRVDNLQLYSYIPGVTLL